MSARSSRKKIEQQLQNVFRRHLGASRSVTRVLVPPTVSAGKLYEAHVLGRVLEHLAVDERYSMTLVGGTKVQLKNAPGPINRSYPHIELNRVLGDFCLRHSDRHVATDQHAQKHRKCLFVRLRGRVRSQTIMSSQSAQRPQTSDLYVARSAGRLSATHSVFLRGHHMPGKRRTITVLV